MEGVCDVCETEVTKGLLRMFVGHGFVLEGIRYLSYLLVFLSTITDKSERARASCGRGSEMRRSGINGISAVRSIVGSE